MRDILEKIAESISSDVDGAEDWTIVPYKRVWRKPSGKFLCIYFEDTVDAGFRTTGSVEESHTVVLEYVEPAPEGAKLQRDEEGELAADDTAASLRAWTRANQSLPTTTPVVTALDHAQTRYVSGVPREALVRYCMVRIVLRTTATYE